MVDQVVSRKKKGCARSPEYWSAIAGLLNQVDAAVVLAAAGALITLIGHGRIVVSIVGFFWFVVSAFLLKGLAGNTAR